MNENLLLPSVTRLLKGRGRWIRAGQDNIVKYLSVRIECGPNRIQELHDLLISSPDPLHVEHDSGRIIKIGLRQWIDNDAIETELALDLPKELASAHALIIRQEREIHELERVSAGATDAALALELAVSSEADCVDLRAQLEQVIAERNELQRQLAAIDTPEIATLRTQLANAQSANESIRRAFGTQAQELTAALRTISELKTENQDLSEMKEFLQSREGHALLHVVDAAWQARGQLSVALGI